MSLVPGLGFDLDSSPRRLDHLLVEVDLPAKTFDPEVFVEDRHHQIIVLLHFTEDRHPPCSKDFLVVHRLSSRLRNTLLSIARL